LECTNLGPRTLVLTRMQKIVLFFGHRETPERCRGETRLDAITKAIYIYVYIYIYKALQKLANRDDTVNDTHSETM